jgi:Protein of unknown function (DUF3185)
LALIWRGPIDENYKTRGLIGIVLLVIGVSIALVGYALDATYCKSLGKMIEGFYTTKAAYSCPSDTYILLVIGGAAVSIVGIILLIVALKSKNLESIKKPLTSVGVLVGATIVIAIAIMIISVFTEYVPSNDITTPAGNSNFTLFIQRPSTILIPVRNIINETQYPLQITVFHEKPPISKIERIRLSTSADSILSYYNSEAKNTTSESPLNTTSESPLNTTSETPLNSTSIIPPKSASKIVYSMEVRAQHNGQVSNTTNPYNVDLFYTDINGRHATYTATFSWPVKTLDFNILVYFFIVFIGVVVSRYTTNIIESKDNPEKFATKGSDRTPSHFIKADGIWILVSGVITLLIFSSFQQQVELTSFLLTNISLAFTFGFGFDKILATGSKIAGTGGS